MGWTYHWALYVTVERQYLHFDRKMLTAESLGELLPLVHRARSDPKVVKWRLEKLTTLDESDMPEVCPSCGRDLRSSVPGLSAQQRWWECATCPGHMAWTCGCGFRTVHPVPGADCAAIRAGSESR